MDIVVELGHSLPSRRPIRAMGAVVLGAYILLAAIASSPVVFGDKTLGPEYAMEKDRFYGSGSHETRFYSDETPVRLDYPRDMMIARSLRSGRPFAWNPLVAAGVPLLAEQSGAFFPLRALFYALPCPASYTLFRMSRMILAALGAFLLARSRGRSIWASFVAGGLFELGGGVIWMLPYAGTSSAFVVPWLVWGVNLLFEPRARLSVAVTGGAIGLILLGGHPGVTAASLLAGVASFLGAALENARAPRVVVRALGWAAVSALLGIGIAACTVFPFAELLWQGHSYKGTSVGLSIWMSNITQARGSWWVGAFAPRMVDKLRGVTGNYPCTLSSLYGLLTLFLAMVAGLRGGVDGRLGMMLLFGVVLSFLPPGFAWTASLPGVQYILSPYGSVLLALPISQWAASGIERLSNQRSQIIFRLSRSDHARAYEISNHGLTTLLALAFLATSAWLSFDLMNETLRNEVGHLLLPLTWNWVGLPYACALLVIGIAVVLGRRNQAATGLLLGVAALAELAAYDIPHFSNPVSRSVRQGRPSGVAEVARMVTQSHDRMATSAWIALPQYNLLDGIRDLRITSALVPKRYADYMSLLGSNFLTDYAPSKVASPLLDVAAVAFSILPDLGTPSPGRAYAGRGWGLFVNEQAASRARLVPVVHMVESEEQARAWLAEAAGGASHMSETVLKDEAVVETAELPSALKQALREANGTPAAEPGTAKFMDDEPDHVSILVQTKKPELLVLADTHYPGWQARIDGERTPIAATNVLFRGVLVESGKHLVEFDYRPHALWLGLLLSLLGSLTVAGLLLGSRKGQGEGARRGLARRVQAQWLHRGRHESVT
jgi:hypothetical protein